MSMDWDDFWELGEEPVDIAFPDDTNFDKVPYMIVMYELDPLTEIPEAPEPVEMCMGANATARKLKTMSTKNKGVLFSAFPVLSLSFLE
jgi:hypothetical protein